MDIKQQTKETYDKIASGFSASHFDHFWVDEFDFFKKIVNGHKVIDIGCGAGRDAAIFVDSGFDYTGIDISEGMLKVARERVPHGKFLQTDFDNIDFPDNTFDCFWAAAAFLHTPKKEVSNNLQEAKRITKNSGIGFISLKEKTEMDEGIIHEDKYGGISRYFAFYEKDEFKQILEQNGFSIIKTTIHTEDDARKTMWLCYFVKIIK